MKIKKIKFSNFRSFVEPAEIEFPGPGLYCIKGLNQETGSSSGAGKSNFHYAISHLLGYCPIPSTELQTYLSDDKYKVEGVFEVDDKEVFISRGSQVKFKMGSDPEIVGASAVNDTVKNLLKIEPELVKALTFRPQRSFGAFFSKTDQEKKTFLSSVLNLEVFSEARTVSREKARFFERRISEHEGSIQALNSSLVEPERPDIELLERSIKKKAALIEKKDALTAESRDLLIEISDEKNALKLLNKKLSDEKERQFSVKFKELEDSSKNIQLECSKLSKKIMECERDHNFYKSEAQKRDSQMTSCDVTVKKLDEGECPVCNQKWNESFDHKKEVLQQRVTYEKEYFKFQSLMSQTSKRKATIEEETKTYSESLKEIDAQKRSIKETVARLVAPIQEEIKVQEAKILELEGSELQRKREFDSIMNQISSLGDTIAKLSSERAVYDRLNSIFLQTTDKIKEKTKELQDAQLKFQTEQHLEGLCRDFVAYLFSEVLNEISVKTTNAMSHIPNVREVSISFEVLDVTKGAGLKAEIRPVIKKGSHVVSPKTGLSGGQFSSMELILDLVIAQIISQRMGKSFNWLILDEPFDGMGSADKEAALSLIKQMCPDKIVLIIDHSVDIQGYFDKIIDIEYNSGMSRLVGVSES